MPIDVPQRDPCPFCENFEGRFTEHHGVPAIVFEDAEVYVFLAPAPLGGMPGHTLVLPRRHMGTILDLTADEEAALAHAVGRTARAVQRALDPSGLVVQQHNGVSGHQGIPHVHFHVIPTREPTTFPPTEWVPVTPYEERAELAALIASHWS